MTPVSNRRVLVLGSSGMLGSMVQRVAERQGHHVVCIGHNTSGFDAIKSDCFEGLNDLKTFDLVVNAIAWTKPIKEEKDLDTLFRVNSLFPQRLASWGERHSNRILHISTDAVFKNRREPYTEADQPDPEDFYGLSKFLGEVNAPHVLNVRCSIVGPEKDSSRHILQWLLDHKDGEIVPGFTNHLWHGATTLQLALWCLTLTNPDGFCTLRSKSHVLHYAPNAPVSKYELLQEIVNAYGRKIKIVPTVADYRKQRLLNTLFSKDLGFKTSQFMMSEVIKQLASMNKLED